MLGSNGGWEWRPAHLLSNTRAQEKRRWWGGYGQTVRRPLPLTILCLTLPCPSWQARGVLFDTALNHPPTLDKVGIVRAFWHQDGLSK